MCVCVCVFSRPGLNVTILPVVTKALPISSRFAPYEFLSRCKFSTLTTHRPMVEFYLLTFSRFSLRKKEHKFCFDKNRTHDFRTINSRCAGYLLDHSGDEAYSLYLSLKPHVFPRGHRPPSLADLSHTPHPVLRESCASTQNLHLKLPMTMRVVGCVVVASTAIVAK